VTLPVWFATVLGMGPPPDAGGWLIELLAYRATDGITEPAVALGAAPDPSESRQWSWHSRLRYAGTTDMRDATSVSAPACRSTRLSRHRLPRRATVRSG